jgi:hypothetical protein
VARIVITAAHVARDQARPREEWRRAWRPIDPGEPLRGDGVGRRLRPATHGARLGATGGPHRVRRLPARGSGVRQGAIARLAGR